MRLERAILLNTVGNTKAAMIEIIIITTINSIKVNTFPCFNLFFIYKNSFFIVNLVHLSAIGWVQNFGKTILLALRYSDLLDKNYTPFHWDVMPQLSVVSIVCSIHFSG